MFFQRQANSHQIFILIDKLMMEGNLVEDDRLIKGHIKGFYQYVLTETDGWTPSWEDDSMRKLQDEDKDLLERPFTID